MFRCVALLLPFALLFTAEAPAQEQAEARKLLLKIVHAKGGDKLHKLEAYQLHLRSTLFMPNGTKVTVVGKSRHRGFDHSWMESHDGTNQTIAVLDENRGWMRENGKTRNMSAAELEGAKESAYLAWISVILPCHGNNFTLQRLFPDEKIEKRRVVGLRISHKGRPDLDLWVDAETHRIVRQRYKTIQSNGQEVEMVSWIGGHKQYDGIWHYTYFVTYRNGVKLMETDVVDAKFHLDGRKVEFSRP